MESITFSYDDLSDSLYIFFGTNRPATGVPINDAILLRIDWEKKQLIGLTIFDYKTTCKQGQLELYGLNELDQKSSKFVRTLLKTRPLSQFLKMTVENKVSVSPIKIESAPIKVNIEDILAA
jgi:uncharacterized protein YuzE